MKHEIKLTSSDLQGEYVDIYDCPMHRAMRRAGLSVELVSTFHWMDTDFLRHEFSDETKQFAVDLGDAADLGKMDTFLGRTFIVED